jgi:alpha-L-fucosidase 2
MATPLGQMSYQPIGDLLLDLPGLGPLVDYRRELDLDAALATTRFATQYLRYRRAVVASPVDQVIAIELTCDRPGRIDLDVALTTPQRAPLPRAATRSGSRARPGGERRGRRAALRHGRPRDGAGRRDRARGERLAVRGADTVTILVAMATSYRRFDDVGDPASTTAAQIERCAQGLCPHRRRDGGRAPAAVPPRPSGPGPHPGGGPTNASAPAQPRTIRRWRRSISITGATC